MYLELHEESAVAAIATTAITTAAAAAVTTAIAAVATAVDVVTVEIHQDKATSIVDEWVIQANIANRRFS